MSLETPAGRAAGVGLPALILCLLLPLDSSMLCLLDPPTPVLGVLFLAAVPFIFPFRLAAGFGGGWAVMRAIPADRRNMP